MPLQPRLRRLPFSPPPSLQSLQPSIPKAGWHRLAVALALGTLLLIAIGGLVTSHGAGMAVPDWPNSYGYNMFAFPASQWIGGILYEHSHRLWASFIGFLVLALAVWVNGTSSRAWLRWGGALLVALGVSLAFKNSVSLGNIVFLTGTGLVSMVLSWFWPACPPGPKSFRILCGVALALVIVQGLLGGLRVVLLMDGLGIVHAALAQAFFCLCAVIAVVSSPWWIGGGGKSLPPTSHRSLRWVVPTLAIAIFLQLLLGASMRHQHAGLAIPDFPLAYGKLWPPTDPAFLESINNTRVDVRDFHPITAGQILLHMAHRLTALAIVGWVVVVVVLAFRGPTGIWRLWSLTGAGLVGVQVALGAWTVWSNKAADVATAHVVIGAATLAWSVLFSLVLAVAPATAHAPDGMKIAQGRDPLSPRANSMA